MAASRGKVAVEEPVKAPDGAGSRLESRNTNPHRDWLRAEGTP